MNDEKVRTSREILREYEEEQKRTAIRSAAVDEVVREHMYTFHPLLLDIGVPAALRSFAYDVWDAAKENLT